MKKVNIDFSVAYQEPVEISLMINMDSVEDPAKRVEMAHDFSVVLAMVGKGGKTNARCAEIIRLRYLASTPMTQGVIAKRMGISTCRVQQLEGRALKRLRKFGVRMGLVEVQPRMIPSRPQL